MSRWRHVGATLEVARRAGSSPASTLEQIVGVFKSVCVKKWAIYLALNGGNLKESFWQYLSCQYKVERSHQRLG